MLVLTFKSVYEILKDDNSNESYREVLSFGAFYCAIQAKVVLTFEFVSMKSKV